MKISDLFVLLPWVTWGICALIALGFGLELYTGAIERPSVMLAHGALRGEELASGELWRMLSSGFLHRDWFHVGSNLYVLWSLGPPSVSSP